MSALSVLCFNCFGSPISLNRKQRFVVIAQEIERLNPDVVMLQEVITPRSSRLLDKELGKYGWQAFYSSGRLLRLGGLTMYSKKYPLRQLQFHQFTTQGPLMSWSLADRMVGKGFQSAVVTIDGHDILLINTHTHVTCNYSGNFAKGTFQEQQLTQLSEFIKNQPYRDIILAGDLSCQPSTTRIKNFIFQAQLSDTLAKDSITVDPENSKGNWVLNVLRNEQPFRVDYVMVSPNLTVNQSDVVLAEKCQVKNRPTPLSDHFGILTQLAIPPLSA